MADKSTNIILAAFLIAFAVFGGLMLLYSHNNHESLETIINSLGPLADLPRVVALPDNSPPTCSRDYEVTLSDASVYIEPKQKPDGSVCSSACLNAAESQVCLGGECVGTCAGECPSNAVADCPVLKLATAMSVPGMNDTFKICMRGKCLYFISNPHNAYLQYYLGMVSHYDDSTALPAELLSKACLDFIDDTEPAKKCLKATFIPTVNTLNVESVCLYTYECSRYSVYAGIGNGTYTLVSELDRNGQPILTVEKIAAALEAAKASSSRTGSRGFQPITIPRN